MRRINSLFVSLTLAATLDGCQDQPPTGVARELAMTPHPTTNLGIVPHDGGVISSPVVTISNDVGGQHSPRVSDNGDLVCYADAAIDGLRYWTFATRVSNAVPDGDRGSQCAVDGSRIAFTRLISEFGETRQAIMLFDAGTSFTEELDPQAGSARSQPAIAGNAVAFVEDKGNGYDIRTIGLPLGQQALVVTEEGLVQARPNISPNGNVVVWQNCDGTGVCEVLKAVRTSTWTPEAVGDEDREVDPDTDGGYVAYVGFFGADEDVETDILIQLGSGGPVTQLAIPGMQGHPRITKGVVSFASAVFDPDAGTWSSQLNLYVIATNTLYRIAATAGAERSDLAILPNGEVHMVWDVPGQSLFLTSDVFATTFVLPGSFPFGGFLAPVNNSPTVNVAKAGAAIPVRFSLGGDRGLNFFTSGSPSSVAVICNTVTTTDAVEETVAAGKSTLTYDATSDTYSYIWKTDRAWANTCRRLTLEFVDGTVATAEFQFIR